VAGIDPTNGIVEDARQSVVDAISAMKKNEFSDKPLFKESLRIALKRFIQKEAGGKPVIIPMIVEI
jgi:mRNA degradation ribonuclease J1/J2